MSIRGLDAHIRERGLLQTAPLSALAGSRLGIDANHYLTKLLNNSDSHEPFVAATGGVHLAICLRVENDLRTLDRNQIKPVFIFPGLPTREERSPAKGPDVRDDLEQKTKEDAWELYEHGETVQAAAMLASIRGRNWPDTTDIIRSVLRVFKHRLVEYIFAPYLVKSQLAYLLNRPKGYIHAIYSSDNALLWPVDKVITAIDFPSSFTFIDKRALLMDLQVSQDQLLDIGILAGGTMCTTLPIVNTVDFSLRPVIDVVRNYQNGITAIDQIAPQAPPQMKIASYREEYIRARQAIRHGFVLTTQGTCLPLALTIPSPQVASPADVPADIDKIFSPRLPDELYFYMCKGVISPAVIAWLTTGNVVEGFPLSDSQEYHNFIQKTITEGVTSQRVLSLAILLDALHPQWKQRRINAHYYFEPINHNAHESAVTLDNPSTAELIGHLSSWTVPFAILQQELVRQNMSTIDVRLCIGALSNAETAKKTLLKHPRPLERKDEFVANVIWRFLTIRGFIHGTDHTLSVIGQGLHTALAQSKVNDRFQEPLTIIIELLRSGVLHGLCFGDQYRSGGPVIGNEQDENSTMLIMRSLSVLPLNFRPQQWAGPLSRELLVFNSFTRAISKSSRQLLEAISVHMLLKGSAMRDRDDFMDLALSLPFQCEANTGFGILFKAYLDVTLYNYEGDLITSENANSEGAKSAKAEALEFVENNFESVKNPKAEVDRGFRFWDTIMVAVRTMAKLQETKQDDHPAFPDPEVTLEEFEMADRWLQPMRP